MLARVHRHCVLAQLGNSLVRPTAGDALNLIIAARVELGLLHGVEIDTRSLELWELWSWRL